MNKYFVIFLATAIVLIVIVVMAALNIFKEDASNQLRQQEEMAAAALEAEVLAGYSATSDAQLDTYSADLENELLEASE